LHWNGHAWLQVPVPYPTQADGDISQDGHDGIWMYAIGPATPAGALTYLYHYAHGQWSRQPPRPWAARPRRSACCPGARVHVRGGPQPARGTGDCCCATTRHPWAISRIPRPKPTSLRKTGNGPPVPRLASRGPPPQGGDAQNTRICIAAGLPKLDPTAACHRHRWEAMAAQKRPVALVR
jgi:hypothetical protein